MINKFGYFDNFAPARAVARQRLHELVEPHRPHVSGRHLPPSTQEQQAALPDEADVVALYRRERMIRAPDTSVMFMFFAQWFTDSFLRTSLTDYRKNESNHEIDLCQIYGRNIEATNLLRSKQGGRLKSQGHRSTARSIPNSCSLLARWVSRRCSKRSSKGCSNQPSSPT